MTTRQQLSKLWWVCRGESEVRLGIKGTAESRFRGESQHWVAPMRRKTEARKQAENSVLADAWVAVGLAAQRAVVSPGGTGHFGGFVPQRRWRVIVSDK